MATVDVSSKQNEMAERDTTCILDCPDACSLTVEQDPQGGVKVRAGEQNPDTAGFICSKVSRFDKRLDSPLRVLKPLRRSGPKGSGEFEETSWEEAIEAIASTLRGVVESHGGEAVLPCHYGGSNGKLTDGWVDRLFFARLGASRLDRNICAAPTSAVATEMYGKMPGTSYQDFEHAKAILVWGANPKASGIHLVPSLKKAKAKGAFLAVIDPVQNFSDREVDLHLALLPGTDLPLALALIHRLQETESLDHAFLAQHTVGSEKLLAAAADWSVDRAAEVCGVAADDIRRLADEYAAADPAVVRCGWGIERNRNGGQAAAAILALPAVAGKFGKRGGGYLMSNGGALKAPGLDQAMGMPAWGTRVVSQTRLGEALTRLDPPVQAMVVYNCNPVATVPDQNLIIEGMQREDLFTVVLEQVMTDTAELADWVLPATTMLEHWDLRSGYGSYTVGAARPVVERRGSARPNLEIFSALGRAMGFEDEAFGLGEEQALELISAHVRMAEDPVDLTALKNGEALPYRFRGEDGSQSTGPIPFGNIQPWTSDGLAHLTPSCLGETPYRFEAPDPAFPLALLSPATGKLINSTFGEHSLDRLTVMLHPEDAQERGFEGGQEVRVFNDLGEVWCHLQISARTRRGVAVLPKGAWRRASLNRATATALCDASENIVAQGACYNDARVEIVAR
ncbi:MAG: molybdopterin-dependent oxidoreductase [Acidobacteriota bacterium]